MKTIDVPTFEALSQEEQIQRIELLGRVALTEFGVTPTSIEPLVHAENTTYHVMAKEGEFCLRVGRPGYQSTANVRSEIAFLSDLRVAGHSVPRPYARKVVTAETPEVPQRRDCVLLQWQTGEFRKAEISPEDAGKVGKVMAGFHLFARGWTPPETFDRQSLHAWALDDMPTVELDRPPGMIGAEDLALLRQVDAESRAILHSLPQTPEHFGIIHADLHNGNVLYEGEETHVIDFDDLGWGFWMFDFASALAYQVGGARFPEVQEAMLAGYEIRRPLPPETRELLPAFLRMRLMRVAVWVLGRTDNPRIREVGGDWIEGMCRRIRLCQGAS